MKRSVMIILLGVSALIVVPVLLARFNESAPRSFQRVKLRDTSYQEIKFTNDMQNLNLAGMLFVPEGAGPFPAAVIIHGSGTSRRDNGWYLTLTRYLQEHGIAVLLPDKRGSENSEGDWRSSSFKDLSSDTVAALEYLQKQPEVVISGKGIIGLSQGGLIAPVVAGQVDDLDFLVSIVGGSVSMHDLLHYEETHNLRKMGVLPGLAELLAYPSSWSIRYVRQKEFWKTVGNFDPLPHWREVSCNSLVLLGENDTNVPSSKSAERLRNLKKPNIDVRIYEGSGHALEPPEGKGESIFREDALEDVRDFIMFSAKNG